MKNPVLKLSSYKHAYKLALYESYIDVYIKSVLNKAEIIYNLYLFC